MRKLFFAFLLGSTLLNCQSESFTSFSEAALNDEFISLSDERVSFSTVLEKHKGKTIFVDVWASWCKDCLKAIPKFKELQSEFPEMAYVHLSLEIGRAHV